jgi:translation initiation factor 2 gamma subunit (eIF-2gamma)
MKDSICKNAPIIPISAQMKYNIDGILEAIC